MSTLNDSFAKCKCIFWITFSLGNLSNHRQNHSFGSWALLLVNAKVSCELINLWWNQTRTQYGTHMIVQEVIYISLMCE